MVFTAAKTMLDALILFAICELMALTFALVGGAVIDTFYEAMVSSGLMNMPGGWGRFHHSRLSDRIILCVMYLRMSVWCAYFVPDDLPQIYRGGRTKRKTLQYIPAETMN